MNLILPLVLLVALAGLRQLTPNLFIRKRLQLSLFLLAAALIVEFVTIALPRILSRPTSAAHQNLRVVEPMLILMALMLAAVVLVFNRFRQARISDRYPAIVQDAITFGLFVLAGTYLWPEKLFTTSAVGAVVVGFALQDTLGNLFSGLAIQIEKPFAVGDWIHVVDQDGLVQEVTWRATKIRTKAGNFVIIPNSQISKDRIINYSLPSKIMRVEFKISIDYAVLPNRFKDVVMGTIREVSGTVREPAPDILLTEYGDSGILYRCRFWIDDFGRLEPIMDSFTTLLYYRLQRANIRIPYPIRDVRITERAAAPEPPPDPRLGFVARSDIFRDLSSEDKSLIAACLKSVTFAEKEVIARQGEMGNSMYFIASGAVDVLLEGVQASVHLATLHEGGYFGEMSLLTGEPRTATAIASTDVHAFLLGKEDFRDVLLRDPSMVETMSRTVAERRIALEQKSAEIGKEMPTLEQEEESILSKISKFFGL